MIAKVVSGGQTGVDIAALRAAKRVGIETGGWATLGWKTLAGARPEYRALYGMKECRKPGYAARTELNAIDSHATLQIAEHFSSTGELCTTRAVAQHARPCFRVALSRSMGQLRASPSSRNGARDWIMTLGEDAPIVLNVAGNSSKTAPGIEPFAEEWLVELFLRVEERP